MDERWTEKSLKRIWEILGEIYGMPFYRDHGEQMPKTWRESLLQISPADALRGLEVCRTFGDQYPINLSQFMGRVKDSKTRAHHKATARLMAPTELREARKEWARQGIAAIRKTISQAGG